MSSSVLKDGEKLQNIEKKKEELVMKDMMELSIARIQNRRKYAYEKTDNIDHTCNNIGRM